MANISNHNPDWCSENPALAHMLSGHPLSLIPFWYKYDLYAELI
jgi:hypothetical protein